MGIGNIVSSIFGGGKSGGNQGGGLGAASVYVPQNSSTNDTNFQHTLQTLIGQGGQGTTAANQVINNPYAPGLQTSANNAGAALDQIGNSARTQGQHITQNANQALPYSNQILNNAFDPQHALYDRTLQQVQDQSRAASSAAGLGTSGVGVGMENDAVKNFNIDWQNNQLARQNQGIQGYDSLLSSILGSLTGGANLKQQGVNEIAEGGLLPYQAYNTPPTADLSALSSAQSLNQQSLADILSYLGLGTNASGVANQSAQQANTNLSGIATGLGGLLGSSGSSGSSGTGQWLNPDTGILENIGSSSKGSSSTLSSVLKYLPAIASFL